MTLTGKSASERLLLRFGEHLAPPEGTIAAHQGVIEKVGYVWYGKLGQPLLRARVEAIVRSAINSSPGALILASSDKKSRRFYEASVAEVVWVAPGEREHRCIPAYMLGRIDGASAWFKITRLREMGTPDVSALVVASSGQRIREALERSTSATMYVKPGSGGGLVIAHVADPDWLELDGDDIHDFELYDE